MLELGKKTCTYVYRCISKEQTLAFIHDNSFVYFYIELSYLIMVLRAVLVQMTLLSPLTQV